MTLRAWARSFFVPAAGERRRARSSSAATRLRPWGESLESRLNMDGNLVAYTAGGNLFINGDNLANEVRIEGNGTGVVAVTAVNGSLNGVLGGRLNARNIQNMFLELGNGDDKAQFVQTSITSLLRFNGGNGDDALLFGEGNSGQNSFGTLVASMGAGNDLILVDAFETSFRVPGSVTIANGEGLNTTYLNSTSSLVLGPTTITGGSSSDNVQIGVDAATVTTGPLSVNGGNGGNVTSLAGNAVVVNGGISLFGGSGEDNFFTGAGSKLTVNGSLTASLGDGGNELYFDLNSEVVVTGVVSQIGGTGPDRFELFTNKFDALAVSFSLGAGENEVALDSGATLIRSNLTITSTGNDGAFIWLAGLDVRGATVVTTGNGADGIIIHNSRFRGAVSMLTTGGNDQIQVDRNAAFDDGIGSRFDSTTSIDLGAGNDTLELAFDSNDFVTFARLIANGGAGTDTFTNSVFNVYTFPRTLISFP